MCFTKLLIFVLIFVLGSCIAKDLPKHFPRCRRNDQNLGKCLLEATEKLRPDIAKGVPSLQLSPFEPFFLKELNVEQGTKAVNFKAALRDVLIHNLTSYKFSRFDFDVPNLELISESSFKQLKLEGKYSVSGKILVVPLEGIGNFTVTLEDCVASVRQKFNIQKRKGAEYLSPISTNGSLKVGGSKAHLDGLYGGNEELGNFTNKFINDNIDELVKEMQPVINQVLSSIVEDLVIKVVAKQVPLDKLFPK